MPPYSPPPPEKVENVPSPGEIERLQRQLIDPDVGLQDYIATARRLKHGLQVVLFILPDGKLGKPKLSIDTRGDKR